MSEIKTNTEVKEIKTTIENAMATLTPIEGAADAVVETRKRLAEEAANYLQPTLKEAAEKMVSLMSDMGSKDYQEAQKTVSDLQMVHTNLTGEGTPDAKLGDKIFTESFVSNFKTLKKKEDKEKRQAFYDAILAYNKAIKTNADNAMVEKRIAVLSPVAKVPVANTVFEKSGLDITGFADFLISVKGSRTRSTSGNTTKQTKVWTFVVNDKTYVSESNHSDTLSEILKENGVTEFEHKECSFKDGRFSNKKYTTEKGTESTYTADPKTRCRQIESATKLVIKASWAYAE